MKATLRVTAKSLWRLLRYTKGNRLSFFIGLLLDGLQNTTFNVVFATVLMTMFTGTENGDRGAIVQVLITLGFGFLAFLAVAVLGPWLQQRAATRSVARLRSEVLAHTLTLPSSWFEQHHSGDVLSRLTADMQAGEQALGWQLRFPLRGILAGLSGGFMMFVLNWRLALVAVAVGLLSVWATTRFADPVKRLSEHIQAALAIVSERAGDLLGAAAVLRVFNLGSWAQARMDDGTAQVYRHTMRRVHVQTAQDTVNSLAVWMLFVGLITIGSYGVLRGSLSFATVIGLVQYNNGLSFLFQTIGGSFVQLQASLAGADRVFELLDTPAEPATGPRPEPKTEEPAVRLDEVSFAYEDGTPVLRSLTETIERGERIALVGGSGSGKSTVLKLLMGFYEAHEGQIALFGHRFAGTGPALRELVAYVPQSCYLFTGTVRDNIAAGRADATQDDIERVARAALAHDFIVALPQGYDTQVGERGAQLSGGQRQRIAIARALLKDAPLLLLDEATASLDSHSEELVQQALESLMEGRTVIIVAHRLSTVRHADRILVLEDGQVAERGTHGELLAVDGRYAAFCRSGDREIAVN